jgi:ABC-type glycerol-3-phosphate transport system substrate-binding protein
MGTGERLSRRSLLHAGAVLGGTAVLAACGATPTPQVVEKVVTQVVEKEVTTIVEGTPQVVKETVVVNQTQVVEKLVTAAPSDVAGQVRVWTFPMTDDDENLIWKPLNQRLAEAYPKLQVSLEILPWSGRREKMLTAYAAGQQPDLAYVNTDTLSLFGTNDVLVALDDIVPKEAWDDLPGSLDAGLSWEGKRLMFPNGLSGSGYLCNKALMTEVGHDPENPPYTWDDIRTLGADSKAKGYFTTSIQTTQWGA